MTVPVPATVAASSRSYNLTGGHPALDLVNTLDWRFRDGAKDELLGSYDDLVGFAEQSQLLTAKQARELKRSTGANAADRVLRECRELREALADLFYARLDGREPARAQLRILDRFYKSLSERQQLTWREPHLQWEITVAETAADFPLWLLVCAASDLSLSTEMEKLRACGDPECRWLFLDTSKNHTRRWCDMKVCGNRMKARRFKAQRKA